MRKNAENECAKTRKTDGATSGNTLDRTEGNLEKLAGVLQEKYGYTRAKADEEIERRLKEFDQKHSKQA